MNEYQDLVRKLALINESASIISLDVTASSNDAQQLKCVLIGLTLSNGASASMTVQSADFDSLLEALETIFTVQGQIIEQAIDSVNVMATTDCGGEEMGPMEPGMVAVGGELGLDGGEIPADGEVDFTVGDGLGDDMVGGEPEADVVVDDGEFEPEIGPDVETEEGRYSHNYSFRNKGTGLFQSLTGQQRISKGALKAAKRRLGN